MRKLTTEEFIERVRKVHKDRYDYSLVEYNGMHNKVKIVCKKHGMFEQLPFNHVKAQGCVECRNEYLSLKFKSTTEEFIKKARKVHGDKYDYSLVDYKNAKSKVKIICKKHGVFEQLPYNHLNDKGCFRCVKNLKDDIFSFIKKAIKIHGDKYDYSLVDYKNTKSKVKIICKKHGVFEQRANSHLNGHGCLECADNIKLSIVEFIKRAKDIHGDKYDYSLVDYKNAKSKVKIICKKHGVFEQTPNNHLSGCGCPNCQGSVGEFIIKRYLHENNIKYKTQKTFNDCVYIKLLRFDFYLPNHNICIEYDGEQHFKPIKIFGGSKRFKNTQRNDNIKNKFCINNNIKLLRIPYTELKNIKNILNKEIKNELCHFDRKWT